MSDKTYYEWNKISEGIEETVAEAVRKAQTDQIFRAGYEFYLQGVEFYLAQGLDQHFAETLSREVTLYSLFTGRNQNLG